MKWNAINALITAKVECQEIILFWFSSKFLFLVITSCGMEQVSPVLAESAGWAKPADLSGMVIGRNLMCHKTEVSMGNLVSPAGFKNCEYLLQMGGKCWNVVCVGTVCLVWLCCFCALVSRSLWLGLGFRWGRGIKANHLCFYGKAELSSLL